jgi:carbamoyl-phosphate synthase large subunit
MRIVSDPDSIEISEPVLIDEYLAGAIELDVDALCDGERAWVAAVLEHVEPAGVHSGDSACVLPGPSVTAELEQEICALADALAGRLAIRGLLNLQLALAGGLLYVLEANPRASRTVPFVAKATGIPLVDHACRLMLGADLDALALPARSRPTQAWAKEAIFPEDRFPNAADRGPEMKSTGEVMAGGETVADAYARALRAAGRGRARGRVRSSLQELGCTDPVPWPKNSYSSPQAVVQPVKHP